MKLVLRASAICVIFASAMIGSTPDHAKDSDFDMLKLWNPIVLLGWISPIATFNPSKVSKGHREYFGNIDNVTLERGKKILAFTQQLKYLRLGGVVGVLFTSLKDQLPLTIAVGAPYLVLSGFYLFELKKFEREVEQKIKGLEKDSA